MKQPIKQSFSNTFTKTQQYVKGKHNCQYWRDGMVGGNGENGFITDSDPYNEHIIFQNIHFIMPSCEPRFTPKEVSGELFEARQAVINFDDKWDVNGRKRTSDYAYHPSHQLKLSFDENEYTDYERMTDYESGEVIVKFTDSFGKWERKSFTSRTDNVTVTEIKKSSLGKKVNMEISIDDISALGDFASGDEVNLQYKKIADSDCKYIALIAHYPSYEGSELKDGGYCGLTYIIVNGGKKEKIVAENKNTDEKQNVGNEKNPIIKITNAESVYLITKSQRTHCMGNISDFKGAISYPLLDNLLSDCKFAAEKYGKENFDYNKALTPSAKEHKRLFDAVEFNLNSGDSSTLSNEDLIKLQQNSDRLEKAVVERAYNQGRYAMICCAGKTMSRLGGMWTGEFNAGWRCIYTMDANVNLQSSGMNTGNIVDFGIGYINFVLRQIDDWKENAHLVYGMENAIQVPVNTDGDRAMMVEYDVWYPFEYWNAGASWMIQPIYEFYQCFGNMDIPTDSGRKNLLYEILLPLLTMQANFWLQICTAEYFIDKNGNAKYEKGKRSLLDGEKFLIIPSYSPENHPLGYTSTITANSTMDISAAIDGLNMAINIEEITKTDGFENRIKSYKNLLSRLPSYKFDETGALCEWAMKEYKENNAHRHISHLYCAWPAFETQKNEPLSRACIQAPENRNRENNGKDDTPSHGWVHKGLVYARLKDANACLNTLYTLFHSDIFYTSMMTDHNTDRLSSVYCTDTSFGFIGIINEMLLYSNTGEIELLPALPCEWESGEISKLMARTQATVSIKWDKSSVTAEITSFKKQKISVSFGEKTEIYNFDENETKVIAYEKQ
ncbi:MAG: glycoside hydrolase family 95 protein [Clostridiales bacterium]|nr:glycoside hydrolase family 95 protein [Clostridiales bacterium]